MKFLISVFNREVQWSCTKSKEKVSVATLMYGVSRAANLLSLTDIDPDTDTRAPAHVREKYLLSHIKFQFCLCSQTPTNSYSVMKFNITI